MDRYTEKIVKKYVIVSPDYGTYLWKVGFGANPKYEFTHSVELATKTKNKNDAKFLIRCYFEDTGDDLDLVVIPVEIRYDLINEIDDEKYDDESIVDEIKRARSWN